MDAAEKIAPRLSVRNVLEAARVVGLENGLVPGSQRHIDYMTDCILAAFPQLALEGREEWVRWYAPAYRSVDGVLVQYGIKGADREYAQRQVDQIAADEAAEFGPSRRNEWVVAERLESPWSEVQS